MKGLKILFLWFGCIPVGFADKATAIPVPAPIEPTESDELRLSDNLIQRNPFVPFKAGKSLVENMDISSDFDFLSVVVYPDHQEFSLKEKNQGKPFWLSSDSKSDEESHGLVFRNFYPSDKTLVVQDSFSGNLINIKQNEIKLGNTSPSSYSSGLDWASLLSDYDDDDDDDDIPLPKRLTNDKKLTITKDRK